MTEYSISHLQSHTNEGSTNIPYIGIVMPVYNRYLLLKLALRSLAKSDLKDTVIAFVNDGSRDPRIYAAIRSFRHKDAKVIVIERQGRNSDADLLNGLHYNLQFTANYLFEVVKCKYVCILDSDTLVKPSWLTTELALYQELENEEPLIVTGFNTINHQVIKSNKRFHQKRSLGGINMFFNRNTFMKIFTPLPAYWDECVVTRMNTYRIICTRPSLVQHTGVTGNFSYLWDTDFAHDYVRPYSLWVTLLHMYRLFYKFMLLINDNIRHPLKKHFRRRQMIS